VNYYDFFNNDLWDNYLHQDNRAGQQIEKITIEPKISCILSDELYNQLSLKYSHVTEESHYHATFHHTDTHKTPLWNFEYGFHWLTHSDNPSLAKVLSNYKNTFGNRLGQGAFHFKLNYLSSSELSQVKYFKIFETQSFFEFYHPQLQFRSSQLELAAHYGLSDFLEIGITGKILREKSHKPYPGSVQSKWFNRTTWQNQIFLDFGNYVYSPHLELKYGWDHLSSFNQDYRPILQPWMFKGRLEIAHIPHSRVDDYFGYIDHFDPVINTLNSAFANDQKWQVQTELTFGLGGNVELNYCGHFYYYSSDLRNYLDKNWDISLSLCWQPYKALRLEVVQNSSRNVNNWDTRFSYYIDRYSYADNFEFNIYTKTVNTWRVRIVSLF